MDAAAKAAQEEARKKAEERRKKVAEKPADASATPVPAQRAPEPVTTAILFSETQPAVATDCAAPRWRSQNNLAVWSGHSHAGHVI